MNISVVHSDQRSLEVVNQAISTGQEIKRSPHVGNINNNELALIIGLASLGASLQLEMVDTIQGSDSYSSPRIIQRSELVDIPLISKKKASGYIVGGCIVTADAVAEASKTDFEHTITEGESLVDVHLRSAKEVLPDDVSVRLSSIYFSMIGQTLLKQCFEQAQAMLQRPLRRVEPSGKIKPHQGLIEADDIFGIGEQPKTGILPPLEAMMAIEITQQALSSCGSDSQIVHIAGPDMIQYTKDVTIMNTSIELAHALCSSAGLTSTTSVEYVVPSMTQILNNEQFPKLIDSSVTSHYDLSGKGF